MKTELEYRVSDALEVRAEGDGPKKIVGYAAVFDTLSEPMFGFREKIQKGAFAASVPVDDIRALWNHDENFVLGRNRAGTLKLEEDDRGLRVEIQPPDSEWARGLVASIQRGDVSQMSFAFRTLKDAWDETDPANIVRTLVQVKLFDVSPVTYPAYPTTSVGVRSAEQIMKDHAAERQADEAAKTKERERIAQEGKDRECDLNLISKELL